MAFVIDIAHNRQVALDGQAGSVSRYKHHTLLAVSIRVIGIGFAHRDEYFAALSCRA